MRRRGRTPGVTRRARAGGRILAVLVLGLAAGCRGDRPAARTGGPSAAKSAVPTGAPAPGAAVMEKKSLGVNDRFPEVELHDLEGHVVTTTSLLAGREAIVLFASTTCEACHDLVETWKQLQPQFPAGLPVFIVVDEEVDLAVRYSKQSEILFPVYCDTRSVFYTDYFIDSYPTVLGVGKDGVVLYAVRQAGPLFTPERAAALLAEAQAKRGSGGS